MTDFFDQSQKIMEQFNNAWKSALEENKFPQPPKDLALKGWAAWLKTMRSAYQVNMDAWEMMLERGEDGFFKMLRQSPAYSPEMETQIKNSWRIAASAQKQQRKIIEEALANMEEAILAEKEPEQQ